MENPGRKPSILRTFVQGAVPGAVNVSIMMGLMMLVGGAFGMGIPLLGAVGMVTIGGLFGGVMGVKKQIEEGVTARNHTLTVNSVTRSRDLTPASPAVAAEVSGPSWAERTGRDNGGEDRIRQILANGSLSDRDRASAILADREASAGKSNSI